MEARPRRRLSPASRATPAIIAGLIAGAAVAGYWAVANTARHDRGRGVAEIAAAEAAAVSAKVHDHGQVLVATAGTLGGSVHPAIPLEATLKQQQASSGVTSLGVATVAGGQVMIEQIEPSSAGLVGLDELGNQAGVRTALELARDANAPEAAVASIGGRAEVVIATPLYGSLPAPLDVATRRQSLQGYVIDIEPPAALAGLSPAALGHGLDVRLVDGTATLYAYGSSGRAIPASGSNVATIALPDIAPGWAVVAWSSASRTVLPWVLLVAGVLLAIAAAALAAISARAEADRAQSAIASADQLRLVARVGPLLQGSLDLAEILPTFVVEVSDELDLEGVAIGLLSDEGRLVRAFALGPTSTSMPQDLAHFGQPRGSVASGGEVMLALQTSGRIIGVLIARSRTALSETQLEALRGAGDLLAAALGNVRLYREEQEMVTRLRELDRLKTTFLGSVSHELRTTVTAIEGFAGLLVSQADKINDAQRADFLERIRRNARSLGVLVEDLLDFARLERSGIAVTLQPVDVSDLVPKIVDQTSSILAQRPVSVDVVPGLSAMADPSAFERILVNLLSNAAKYTPDGTEVSVSLAADDGNAVLTVADRGPGIPVAERERVFEQFYRIDNNAARSVRGVGIGLALVRQLVSLLHGTITADETPGGGATFRMTIPLAANSAVAVAAVPSDTANSPT